MTGTQAKCWTRLAGAVGDAGRRARPGAARWVLLAVATGAGTIGIAALGLPSPALFAGLLAGVVLALLGRAPAQVPRPASAAAQGVIGVVIGLLARPGTFVGIAHSWLAVVLVSLGTLAVSMGAGLLLGLHRGVSPLTGMLALTAGGASGLVAISRELGGDDRLVAVVQYLRVGLVTASMPVVAVLLYGAVQGDGPAIPTAPTAPWYICIAVTLGCCVVGIPLARLARLPAGGLLGPMTIALILTLTGLSFDAQPPALLVELAYAVIGWQAEPRFTWESLRTVLTVLPLATTLIAVIVTLCAGLGLALSALTGSTALESYLATTPGGIYAVLATAISSGADVTFVVAVQVLRLLLMLLVAPALARLAARYRRPEAG